MHFRALRFQSGPYGLSDELHGGIKEIWRRVIQGVTMHFRVFQDVPERSQRASQAFGYFGGVLEVFQGIIPCVSGHF